MKKVYLALAGLVTVLALIIAFENIAMSAQILILFEKINSLFMALLLMFFLGMVTGLFLGLAQAQGKPQKKDFDDYNL